MQDLGIYFVNVPNTFFPSFLPYIGYVTIAMVRHEALKEAIPDRFLRMTSQS